MLDKYINNCTLAMYRTLTYYGRIKNCFLLIVTLLRSVHILIFEMINTY